MNYNEKIIIIIILLINIIYSPISLAYASSSSSALPYKNIQQPNKSMSGWQKKTVLSANRDEIWKKGTSGTNLLRRHQTYSDNTPDNQQSKIIMGPSPNKRPKTQQDLDKRLSLNNGTIRPNARTQGSSWHSKTSQSIIIDEDLYNNQYEVVGAYGQMVNEEDFKVTMGPELYINPNESSILGGDDARGESELGMGMKFQWGF